MSAAGGDGDRFRLRHFVDELAQRGELDRVAAPIDPIDVAARLDGNPHAVLFEAVRGGELPVVGNVMASRRRLALALGVEPVDLLAEIERRLRRPLAPLVVARADAPVQALVLTGADADLTRLPLHLQHVGDGSLYVSAAIDVTRSLDGAKRNLGYRRLMVRGPREAGIDLVAPSDLRAIYAEYAAQRRRLPIAFAVGSHPADALAAVGTWPAADELELAGALRGAPVPLVRCVSIDAEVPADAELVLEGYLDERGWSELEGPYGEFFGYDGPPKRNPVFHLTAITRRHDALFQTLTIGGRAMATTDTAQLNALRTESAAWAALRTAVREPVAVYAPPQTGGVAHLRVALRQRVPGDARNAIAALFGSTAELKHVFVVDPDVDVFSDAQIEWALATRFQADRDLVVAEGMRVVPLDPSLAGRRVGAKAGFDLTLPFEESARRRFRVADVPRRGGSPYQASVEAALASGPRTFAELVEARGNGDGRPVVRELDALRAVSRVRREADGRYALTGDERGDRQGGAGGDESGDADRAQE